MMPARLSSRRSLILIGTLSFVITAATPGAAAPGDLDPTFDGDGRVTTDVRPFGFNSDDQAGGVAIQADGKIVAAGHAQVSGTPRALFALARYNTDGSLDPTFDGDGVVTTDFFGGADQHAEARAVAVAGDGKIVAAGFSRPCPDCKSDFALAIYNPDGSVSCRTTTDIAGDIDEAFAMAIHPDGSIFAAGYGVVSGTTTVFAVVKYLPGLCLENNGFDGDGKVTTDFGFGHAIAFGIALQGDDKIVVAGDAAVSGNVDFALARYNPDGSLDPTFDGDGKVTTDFAGDLDTAFAIAIQGDGRIVGAGVSGAFANLNFALARYGTNGSLDPAFDGDGKVTTDFAGGFDRANGVVIQGDGKIVAAGFASDVSGNTDFALTRYNTNGSLDSIFSGDGKVTTDFASSAEQANGVVIQADGKIVAAGCTSCGVGDFALARYTVCRRTSRPMSIPFCP